MPCYVFSRGEGVGTLEEAHLSESHCPQHVGPASDRGSGAHSPLHSPPVDRAAADPVANHCSKRRATVHG